MSMRKRLLTLRVLGLPMAAVLSIAGYASGKAPAPAGKVAPAGKAAPVAAAAAASRNYAELGGKFKWGMSPDEAMGVVENEIRAKFQPKIEAEKEAERQDAVRREMNDTIERMKTSFVRFNGQKLGWDVSIVDREYGHRNQESMVVMWEKDQRRFLFFWKDRLYKQFIAYNTERFAGKTFDEFIEGMQLRYGKAEMSFAKRQTDDEMALDYYQWPAQGDYVLRAIDQTGFYGNFCLTLTQKQVMEDIEKDRTQNSPARVRRQNVHVVDQVSAPGSGVDPNADVIDDVVGKRALPSVEQKRIQERVQREYNKNKAPAPAPAPSN